MAGERWRKSACSTGCKDREVRTSWPRGFPLACSCSYRPPASLLAVFPSPVASTGLPLSAPPDCAGNPTYVTRIQKLRDNFDAARHHCRLNQANAMAAKVISTLPSPSSCPAIRLPLGAPATRPTELRKRTVTEYAQHSECRYTC